jgi:hypothetical protein
MTTNALDFKDNDEFFESAERSLEELFKSAKLRNEVDYAFALEPEERGFKDSRWSSAGESFLAFNDYQKFLAREDLLDEDGRSSAIRIRIALSFYCHLSEAGGFYEIPKKMLSVASGDPYFRTAFARINPTHRHSGNRIVPNANAVFRDLTGHSSSLGFDELSRVFATAFDPDLRNAYSHANYILHSKWLRLKNRATNRIRVVSWEEFNNLFNRGVGFFQIMRGVVQDSISEYEPGKTVLGQLHDEGLGPIVIKYHPAEQCLVISGMNDYWRWVIDTREIFANQKHT